MILHPALMQIRREREGCAKLVTGGEILGQIRERLPAGGRVTDGMLVDPSVS